MEFFFQFTGINTRKTQEHVPRKGGATKISIK